MITVLGIRHHGPGSARSVVAALDELAADCVLVEGPPDADDIIPFVTDEGMQPPVAILVYQPEDPSRAVYYPFARFSPEWQALVWAQARGVSVRFMDLPQAHRMAMRVQRERREVDPLEELGRAAGYGDGERWWEHLVEERRDPAGLFAGILEAMTAVRSTAPEQAERGEEAFREAWMRKTLRAAEKEGFQRIAVVCGAWHAPVITTEGKKGDDALLRGLAKVKVAATWVPWTHGRLALSSGYGAGIQAPGWYAHLFDGGGSAGWLTRVARLLRAEDLDASAAHVIDAVRLADTLAALRGRHLVGLPELVEATQAVLCLGSELPMRLVHEKLIVGEVLGGVPESAPAVPLARDLAAEQRRLRLKADPAEKLLELDLRRAIDLGRSHLLHRLQLLGVLWGEPEEQSAGMGTFRESWRLRWDPELAIGVIEASLWGTTVAEAAAACAVDRARAISDLPRLGALLDLAFLADLPDAAAAAMARLDEVAAVAADVLHLMRALPPLANVLRYGNVRGTDTQIVERVLGGMVARIAVGLPAACASLDDTAAQEMFTQVNAVENALAIAGSAERRAEWHAALGQVAVGPTVHGLVAGRAARILLDAGALDRAEATRRTGLALAATTSPEAGAAWAEGFLRGSGLLLLYDDALWDVVDRWLDGLADEAFIQTLPLLRRTFATFPAGERRKLGERARREAGGAAMPDQAVTDLDLDRAQAVLPLVRRILGCPPTA